MMENGHGFRCADSDNRACCYQSVRNRFWGRGRLRLPRREAARHLDGELSGGQRVDERGGFVFFPIERFTPALGVGAISLIVLAVAILGRYPYHLVGRWRAAYVISSVTAFYFNVF